MVGLGWVMRGGVGVGEARWGLGWVCSRSVSH